MSGFSTDEQVAQMMNELTKAHIEIHHISEAIYDSKNRHLTFRFLSPVSGIPTTDRGKEFACPKCGFK